MHVEGAALVVFGVGAPGLSLSSNGTGDVAHLNATDADPTGYGSNPHGVSLVGCGPSSSSFSDCSVSNNISLVAEWEFCDGNSGCSHGGGGGLVSEICPWPEFARRQASGFCG